MIGLSTQVSSYEYVTQEDRSAPRIRVPIPGHLRSLGGKRLVTTTRDISLSGFAAVAIARVAPGTRCWLSLPDMPALEATAIWWEGGIVGCAFKHLLSGDVLEELVSRWFN